MTSPLTGYTPVEIPTDPVTGYTKAFTDPTDPAAHEFFNVYGFAVFHNVLSHTECSNTIDELWTYIEEQQWQRPSMPCYMANVKLKTIHYENEAQMQGTVPPSEEERGSQRLQTTTLPAMCAANGWNYLSMHMHGPIVIEDNPYQPPVYPDTPYIAMLTNMRTQQETVPQKIQRVAANAACVAILLCEPSGRLQRLPINTKAISHLFQRSASVPAIGIPVLSIASTHPIAGAEECDIHIDAEATWAHPVVTFTQTPAKGDDAAATTTTTTTTTTYTHCAREGVPLDLDVTPRKNVRRYDTRTWTAFHGWENDSEGMIGTVPIWSAQFVRNRSNKKLLQAMKTVLHTYQDVVVSHDRAALFRPMQDTNAQRVWATAKNIHFDCNPWKYFGIPVRPASISSSHSSSSSKVIPPPIQTDPFSRSKSNSLPPPVKPNYDWEGDFMPEYNANPHMTEDGMLSRRVQGLLNLVDNREKDGGFQCVPMGQQHVRKWAEATAHSQVARASTDTFNIIQWKDKNDPRKDETDPTGLADHAKHISMPAGALLLWDYMLPHGSTPNNSTNLRIAQFVKGAPRGEFTEAEWQNRERLLKRILPPMDKD